MMVEGLPETTWKWKEEHHREAQEGMNMEELAKCLSRVDEALKKTRVEQDASM